MKKKVWDHAPGILFPGANKILLKMKLTLCIILFSLFGAIASETYSQTTKLTLDLKNSTVKEVLGNIESQSEFFFLYSEKIIDVNRYVNIEVQGSTIEKTLDKIFAGTNVNYTVKGRQIVLTTPEANNFFRDSSYQQQKSVSGKVTDSTGGGLPGVSVVVKGTTTGVITDLDGKYTLSKIPGDATLVFSFVGMKTQEIFVGSKIKVDVTLTDESIGLEEVVAVGYGTQKKVNLTGSISTVSAEKLESRPVTNVSSALSGQLSGVSVVKGSGAPGSGASITIRGLGSFGSSAPLVLVDGLETSLDDVLPSDVASISVLKDAASASIYGSRAANGVILITTKRGKASAFRLNYDFYIGKQNPVHLPEFVGAVEYMRMENEARTNVGQVASFPESLISTWAASSDRDAYPNTDWVKEAVTGSGNQQSHVLSLSGGTDDNKYYVSFGMQDQLGIIANNEFKKYSLRINTDTKLYGKLSLKTSVMAFNADTKDPGFSAGWSGVLRIPAIFPARFSNGKYGNWTGYNPIATYEEGNINTTKSYYSLGNFSLNYEILKGLNLEVSPGYKVYSTGYKSRSRTVQTYDYIAATKTIAPGVIMNSPSTLTQSNNTVVDLTLQSLLTYNRKFEKHTIGGLLGYSEESWKSTYFDAFRDNFPTNTLDDLNVGSPKNQRNSGNSNEWGLRSYFGRLNYNFDEKYLFEANVRYDGSSRFSSSNRWGLFPSFSAGWRVSQEEFMKQFAFISNMKLRASWGQLGNQDAVNRLGYYPYISTISPSENYVIGGSVVQGTAISGLANKDVSWETTESTDIGMDLDLFNNKLGIVADYFYRKTIDGLLDFPIPVTTGYISANSYGPWSSVSRATIPRNGASVENKGFELNINYHNNFRGLEYQVGANLTHVKNKILDLKGLGPIINGLNILQEGQPMNALYGYKSEGLFQVGENLNAHAKQDANTSYGDIKYLDLEPDGMIDSKDRTIIGNPNPDMIFGANVNLAYKGFDFSALMQGVGKVDGYRSGTGVWAFANGANVRTNQRDRWTPGNPNASLPRFTYDKYHNFQNSDFWIQSAAYARLKNVQIGYSLPKNVLDIISLEKVRFYLTGENLFTLTKFDKGYDPETQVYGYPQLKSFTVGLNVTF